MALGPASRRYASMTVRQLIRALVKYDLDLEVVIPAGPNLPADFIVVVAVEQDVFAAERQEPPNLTLAELSDPGAFLAVRLCAGPTPAAH
jgi:hypothetical protein